MNVQAILNNVGGDNQEILAQLLNYRNGYTSGNKPKQTIEAICQESGARFTATIFTGTGLRMDDRNLNEVLAFNLSAANIGGKVRLTGFWQSNYVQGGRQGTATPSPAMNRPQATAQPPFAPPAAKAPEQDVWDAKDLRMARMNALNRAVDRGIALVTKGGNDSYLGDPAILAQAEVYRVYIYDGLMTENAQQGEGFQQDDSWQDPQPPDEFDEAMQR